MCLFDRRNSAGDPPLVNQHGKKGRLIAFGGQRRSVAAWARLHGLAARTLNARLARGWSIRRALTCPKRKYIVFDDDSPRGGFQ